MCNICLVCCEPTEHLNTQACILQQRSIFMINLHLMVSFVSVRECLFVSSDVSLVDGGTAPVSCIGEQLQYLYL